MTVAVMDRGAREGSRYKEGEEVPEKTPKISAREEQILRGILLDKTYPQIAHDLGLSLETIKSYVARLRAKLGIDSKVGLALWASRNLQDVTV